MADLLTAASILLFILFSMYILFYEDIMDLFREYGNKISQDDTYKKEIYTEYDIYLFKKSTDVRNSKICPLLFASFIIAIIFTPKLIGLFHEINFHLQDYDTIKAAFIAIVLFMWI